MDSKHLLNEIHRMKSLFSYEKGKVISEQKREDSVDARLMSPETKEEKLAKLILDGVAGGGTNPPRIKYALQQLDNQEQFKKIDDLLKKSYRKQNFSEIINDEFGVYNRKDVDDIQRELKKHGITVTFQGNDADMTPGSFKITYDTKTPSNTPPPPTSVANTREQNIKNVLSKVGKDGIIHSPGNAVDNMKWDDYVSKYSITPQEINAAKGITGGDTPNVVGSPANKTSIVIPKELKDTNGVMAFQNWLDSKYPQGWAERSNGTKYVTGGKPEMGYGRFGRNTARMWAKEGNTYIQELNSGKGELINKTPVNTTLQNQTPVYGGPSAATTAGLNALNAPSPAQPQVQPENPISDGKNLYDGLVARAAETQEPYITKSFGRIRYFGQPIQNFEALNSYITSLGYKQIKEKDGKIVWVKQ